MKGVPVRLEIGPRDIENGQWRTSCAGTTLEKGTLALGRTLPAKSPPCWIRFTTDMLQPGPRLHAKSTPPMATNMEELRNARRADRLRQGRCGAATRRAKTRLKEKFGRLHRGTCPSIRQACSRRYLRLLRQARQKAHLFRQGLLIPSKPTSPRKGIHSPPRRFYRSSETLSRFAPSPAHHTMD